MHTPCAYLRKPALTGPHPPASAHTCTHLRTPLHTRTPYIGLSVCDECDFDGKDCSECMTNGGADKNSKCVFPFIFVGESKNKCIWDGDGAWCSTLVDANGEHVGGQGKWG